MFGPPGYPLRYQAIPPASARILFVEVQLWLLEPPFSYALPQAKPFFLLWLTAIFYSGRRIATNFLTLPNKRQLPDYYEKIQLPIAIDTIEEKLKRRELPDLSAVESWFRQLVLNAKIYNQKGSEIHEDAERLRKASSNYMAKYNPDHKKPGFVLEPLDVKAELEKLAKAMEEVKAELEPGEVPPAKRQRGRPPKNPQAHAQRQSATPAISESQYADIDFDGLNFQQAQEKIMSDMIFHREDPELVIIHSTQFNLLTSVQVMTLEPLSRS